MCDVAGIENTIMAVAVISVMAGALVGAVMAISFFGAEKNENV